MKFEYIEKSSYSVDDNTILRMATSSTSPGLAMFANANNDKHGTDGGLFNCSEDGERV